MFSSFIISKRYLENMKRYHFEFYQFKDVSVLTRHNSAVTDGLVQKTVSDLNVVSDVPTFELDASEVRVAAATRCQAAGNAVRLNDAT